MQVDVVDDGFPVKNAQASLQDAAPSASTGLRLLCPLRTIWSIG